MWQRLNIESGSFCVLESGPVSGLRVGLVRRTSASVEACGARLTAIFCLIFVSSRVGVERKEVNREMSVRRRWRIGWIRRSVGSPAHRAIVFPRA